MTRLEVLKDSIPYVTPITIKGETFYFSFKYNLYDQRIYVDLYDYQNNKLYDSEPILFGIPLWFNKLIGANNNSNKKFPQAYIIPNTKDRKIIKIDYSNIDKVELIIKEFG